MDARTVVLRRVSALIGRDVTDATQFPDLTPEEAQKVREAGEMDDLVEEPRNQPVTRAFRLNPLPALPPFSAVNAVTQEDVLARYRANTKHGV